MLGRRLLSFVSSAKLRTFAFSHFNVLVQWEASQQGNLSHHCTAVLQ